MSTKRCRAPAWLLVTMLAIASVHDVSATSRSLSSSGDVEYDTAVAAAPSLVRAVEAQVTSTSTTRCGPGQPAVWAVSFFEYIPNSTPASLKRKGAEFTTTVGRMAGVSPLDVKMIAIVPEDGAAGYRTTVLFKNADGRTKATMFTNLLRCVHGLGRSGGSRDFSRVHSVPSIHTPN